jgi:hypothetical protein
VREGRLAEGMLRCRAGMMVAVRGAIRVPAARVFSLYVVQAGSAGPRVARPGPAPTAFNRAGEKLRATGGELPGVSDGVGPLRADGLALPLIGRKVFGHPCQVRE